MLICLEKEFAAFVASEVLTFETIKQTPFFPQKFKLQSDLIKKENNEPVKTMMEDKDSEVATPPPHSGYKSGYSRLAAQGDVMFSPTAYTGSRLFLLRK